MRHLIIFILLVLVGCGSAPKEDFDGGTYEGDSFTDWPADAEAEDAEHPDPDGGEGDGGVSSSDAGGDAGSDGTDGGLHDAGAEDSGGSDLGEEDPIPGTLLELSTSGHRTCVLDSDEQVWCWGLVTREPRLEYVGAQQISANCALRGDGRVECWEEYGAFNPGSGDPPTPACIPSGVVQTASGPLTNVVSLARTSSRAFRTCGVTSGGDVWCWGLKEGTCTTQAAQVTGLPAISEVLVGPDDTCALTGTDAWCWGPNFGTPGAGFFDDPVRLRRDVVQVTVGGGHQIFEINVPGGCDSLSPGNICGIGRNDFDQIRSGRGDFLTAWANVGPLTNDAMSAGENHTCLLDGGTLACIGKSIVTTTITTFTAPTELVSGEDYSCVIDLGTVQCWGDNSRLQLGTLGGSRTTPAPIDW